MSDVAVSAGLIRSPRPERHGPKVVAIHMAAIRERVRAYLVSEGEDEPDMDQAMEDVERAMWCDADGYRIARELEDRGWHADSGLVEVMERLAYERWDAHRKVVGEWVAAEGIEPLCGIGARVTFTHRGRLGVSSPAKVDGEIVKIDAAHAQYTVFVESLGHVRDGKIGTLGALVAFEDATLVVNEGGQT